MKRFLRAFGAAYRGFRFEITRTTWVFCPTCGADLIRTASHFGQDDDGLEVYNCTDCHVTSKWDFDAPAPLLRWHSFKTLVTTT